MYQVIFEWKQHPRPAHCDRITDQFWNFMTSCWSENPFEHPSAIEALQFIDHELVLYDQGSVDGGQHPVLVSVRGYTPPLIGLVGQNAPSALPSTRPSQTYLQPLQPVRLLVQFLLYISKILIFTFNSTGRSKTTVSEIATIYARTRYFMQNIATEPRTPHIVMPLILHPPLQYRGEIHSLAESSQNAPRM